MTAADCPACATRADLTWDDDSRSDPEPGSPMRFEFVPGRDGHCSCPDCGRLYLRTLTNGDVPFLYRDIDRFSFKKLAERVTPQGSRPVVAQPSPTPPVTSFERVGRCPKCGSTQVTQDTWEVQDDEVRLTCGACQHHEVVDYPARPGWFVLLELPTEKRVLPPFVSLELEPI